MFLSQRYVFLYESKLIYETKNYRLIISPNKKIKDSKGAISTRICACPSHGKELGLFLSIGVDLPVGKHHRRVANAP